MGFIDQLRVIDTALVKNKQSHYVQAWDKTIYFVPLSPNETNKVVTQGSSGESNAAMWTRYVIMKALDSDGARLFSNDDFQALLEFHFQNEVEELYNKMKAIKTVDEAKQDFTTIPS
ncbi:MAG: hypothetical protein HKK66_03195 [Chlorobiaceae bacterium]|nr:hypothetical protein [Chlorobiaceae bacterium]